MTPDRETSRSNVNAARARWGKLPAPMLRTLEELTRKHQLSVVLGDLLYLNNGWYVTHTGLLRLAARRRCIGIRVQSVESYCDPAGSRWTFKATVYKSRTCKGFVGYGDADPSNVSDLVRGAEMRVAETRAVNRALRKAYGIGLCSVEEIGACPAPPNSPAQSQGLPKPQPANGNGHPLRDRLCLLIRKHALDGNLVKAYAAEFCGVSELRQASREQIASFIKHLADYAQNDRENLLSQLNSYAPKPIALAAEQVQPGEEKVLGAA